MIELNVNICNSTYQHRILDHCKFSLFQLSHTICKQANERQVRNTPVEYFMSTMKINSEHIILCKSPLNRTYARQHRKNHKFLPLFPSTCPPSLNIQRFANMVYGKHKSERNNSIKVNVYDTNEFISSVLGAVKIASKLLLIYCYTF